tara:strand:- start:1016 stop:1468 length:453 start_codon:yes stop_codon:yes gene_type:complete
MSSLTDKCVKRNNFFVERINYLPRFSKNLGAMKKLFFFISFALGGSFLLPNPSAIAHDWVEYGPLKVNIRGWKLNRDRLINDGQTTYDTNFVNIKKNTEGYVSINCERNRLSTTRSDGTWKRYRVSIRKTEKDLKNDFCTAIRKNPNLLD